MLLRFRHPTYKVKLLFFLSLMLLLPSTLFFQADFLGKRFVPGSRIPQCPWCDDAEAEKDVVFVPVSAPVMRLLAPADPFFLADLLWLRTTYYFGHHALTNREYPYLFHLIDLITDLSGHWDWPYYFGAVILPTEAGAVEDGLYVIEKGLAHLPDNWQLWFFKGFYLWKYKGETMLASEALKKASLLPGAPFYLKELSATLATKAGQNELAVRFLTEASQTVKDPEQRRRLMDKIKEILNRDKPGPSMD